MAIIPYKRQKGKPLGKDEKQYNRALSRIRVKVENAIRRLEIFRILCERYRNKRRGYGIKFNIIAGIVNLKMGYRAKIWQSNDADIGMAESLVYGGDVFLIAADAVERLGDKHIEIVALSGFQKRQHARAVTQAAATDGVVGKDFKHGHAVAFSAFTAQADLIVDGRLGLIIRLFEALVNIPHQRLRLSSNADTMRVAGGAA